MHKSAFFGLITLFLATSSLAVEIPESCLSCRAETSDASFMACLESCVNGVSVAIHKDVADLKSAGWFFKTEIDPMTDEKISYVGRLAENSGSYHASVLRPWLIFLKRDGGEGLILWFENTLLMPGYGEDNLTVRVDKNKAVSMEAERNERQNAFKIDDKKILRQMRSGKKLLVRAKISRFETQTFEFDLQGFETAYRWCVSEGRGAEQ